MSLYQKLFIISLKHHAIKILSLIICGLDKQGADRHW